jgi:hypothetical protein
MGTTRPAHRDRPVPSSCRGVSLGVLMPGFASTEPFRRMNSGALASRLPSRLVEEVESVSTAWTADSLPQR